MYLTLQKSPDPLSSGTDGDMTDLLYNSLVLKHLPFLPGASVPPEIRARGPEAELAFQKALQNGKVKVYRGRIMLLGQERAGKTSLKKSFLGMPFNPQEESTVGVEVDPSKCQLDVDQIKNWEPIKDKKLEVSEFAEDIAMFIAKDLTKGLVEKQDISQSAGVLEEVSLMNYICTFVVIFCCCGRDDDFFFFIA